MNIRKCIRKIFCFKANLKLFQKILVFCKNKKKRALLIMNSDFKRQLDSLIDVFNSLILNENLVKKN